MEKLHSLVEKASYIIDAESFEVSPKFRRVDKYYIIDYITIYFANSNISRDKLHSLTFLTEEQAIAGITGFIQLYENVL